MSCTLPSASDSTGGECKYWRTRLAWRRFLVHREHDAARPGRLRGRAAFVVEQRNGRVGVAPHIVLEGEMGARPEAEVARLAPQPPQDLSARALDLVKSPCVPARNYEVAVSRVDVDRIDVEIVPGRFGLRRLV